MSWYIAYITYKNTHYPRAGMTLPPRPPRAAGGMATSHVGVSDGGDSCRGCDPNEVADADCNGGRGPLLRWAEQDAQRGPGRGGRQRNPPAVAATAGQPLGRGPARGRGDVAPERGTRLLMETRRTPPTDVAAGTGAAHLPGVPVSGRNSAPGVRATAAARVRDGTARRPQAPPWGAHAAFWGLLGGLLRREGSRRSFQCCLLAPSHATVLCCPGPASRGRGRDSGPVGSSGVKTCVVFLSISHRAAGERADATRGFRSVFQAERPSAKLCPGDGARASRGSLPTLPHSTPCSVPPRCSRTHTWVHSCLCAET